MSEPNFRGYFRQPSTQPNLNLCQVTRGTPAGEYLRRFWHPIAYLSELGELPLRARALGEDLVVFRDKSDRIGALQLQCCHRNSSLEFGIIEKQGLRCCYHGRLFDVDGSLLEAPGEPNIDRLRQVAFQGAYPTVTWGGIVFVYMGPPDRKPAFPTFDFMRIPSLKIVPGPRLEMECNWLQIIENTLDPAHTATLHTIPQKRGMAHLSPELENFPEVFWSETPVGSAYFSARVVGPHVWLRSAEVIGPLAQRISSPFEDGKILKDCSPPYVTFWTLPVDDDRSVRFMVSHVPENDPIPFEKRRALEVFGQYNDRPYRDRQYIPGDYDAQVSQGPISVHANETLASQDRGVVLFRRYVKKGIAAVEQGADPAGVYRDDPGLLGTYATDRVVRVADAVADATDQAEMRRYLETLVSEYVKNPPLFALLNSGSPK